MYIDTEGSFLAERVAEMAKALRPRTYPAPTPHPGRRHTRRPQTLALTVTRALTTANRDLSPEPAKALLAHLDMLAHRERQPEQLAALATLDINRLLAGAHGRLPTRLQHTLQ